MSSSAGRAKRDREKAKRERAALKRDKRLNGSGDIATDEIDPDAATRPRRSQAEVLAELQQLHERFEAESVSFDDFEVLKAQLMSQLDVG